MNEYEQIEYANKILPHFLELEEEWNIAPFVYQYRDFKSFWLILKSDCFWVTNARFLNDVAEQQFGKDVIGSLCKDKEIKEDLGLDENYIICFCKEDDKLSQWRGYAPEGGVSMGFDFSIPRAFSIINNDVNSDDKQALFKENCKVQYVGLDEVRYIEPQSKEQKDSDYKEYCCKKLNLMNVVNDEEVLRVYCEEIERKAPYIKHSGFLEEAECRLVFRNNNGEFDDAIRYRETKSENLKYPYIVLKSALPERHEKDCVVRVSVNNEIENKIVTELKNEFNHLNLKVVVEGCHILESSQELLEESFCEGCMLRRYKSNSAPHSCRSSCNTEDNSFEYALHARINSIVISEGKDQENIYEIVHNCISKYNKDNTKISVWCEGHLPLRKITVGPCVNQDSIVEAIKYYCKHTYWLRDVEIEVSKIPFRKTL